MFLLQKLMPQINRKAYIYYALSESIKYSNDNNLRCDISKLYKKQVFSELRMFDAFFDNNKEQFIFWFNKYKEYMTDILDYISENPNRVVKYLDDGSWSSNEYEYLKMCDAAKEEFEFYDTMLRMLN